MILDPVVCFLPCRQGSVRIPDKNIKPFYKFKNGLLELKLQQLSQTSEIDKIIVSTDDDRIINFIESNFGKNVTTVKRAACLSQATTATDALVNHATELTKSGHILWTHVTSPFVGSSEYSKIIRQYHEKTAEGYDSLMSAVAIRSFVWHHGKPVNYSRQDVKWPNSQTLSTVHEINSAVFLARRETFIECNDRIGRRPFVYEMDKLVSFDIDWPEDFVLAEKIAASGVVKF